MELPALTDPDGLFDYIITLIIVLALVFAIYWGALYFGYVEPFIFGNIAPAF